MKINIKQQDDKHATIDLYHDTETLLIGEQWLRVQNSTHILTQLIFFYEKV